MKMDIWFLQRNNHLIVFDSIATDQQQPNFLASVQQFGVKPKKITTRKG